MFIVVFFTSIFLLQNVFVESRYYDEYTDSYEEGPPLQDYSNDKTIRFSKGIVPYYIETAIYDSIILGRIQAAMDLIEASSCVVFKNLKFKPANAFNGSWVYFTNPQEIRECVHEPKFGANGEIMMVIGYECVMFRYVIHAVLHSIGFKDEVAHPHRDQYIRIMWKNVQPRYRNLFSLQIPDAQFKVAEYDPMSIMHFHDRAFSINGGPTIAPRVPGLRIKPSDKLSQLDVMKLRMWFGHECNKRKVGALLEKCKTVLHGGLQNQLYAPMEGSIEVDEIEDPYKSHEMYGNVAFYYDDGVEIDADGDVAEGPVDDEGGNTFHEGVDYGGDSVEVDGGDGVQGGHGGQEGEGGQGGGGLGGQEGEGGQGGGGQGGIVEQGVNGFNGESDVPVD